MENRLVSLIARFREFSPARRRMVLGGCALAAVLILFVLASNQNTRPTHQLSPYAPSLVESVNGKILWPNGVGALGSASKEASLPVPFRSPNDFYSAGPRDTANLLREPQVVYSAELSVLTREFARSRSSMEEILDRHHGYVAKLRMVGQPSESILSATFRVPSSEYRSALTELKTVGLVEREEESADEITQQHSELEARLVNAQNEERRIQEMLKDRTTKTSDQEALARQVSLLQGEIDRIEAERYASGNRASFANLFFTMREERTPVAETIGAKLRNAAVGGLSDAFESFSSILLFVASHGPLLVLWAVLIYLPGRYVWRRYRRASALGASVGA